MLRLRSSVRFTSVYASPSPLSSYPWLWQWINVDKSNRPTVLPPDGFSLIEAILIAHYLILLHSIPFEQFINPVNPFHCHSIDQCTSALPMGHRKVNNKCALWPGKEEKNGDRLFKMNWEALRSTRTGEKPYGNDIFATCDATDTESACFEVISVNSAAINVLESEFDFVLKSGIKWDSFRWCDCGGLWCIWATGN